ncbi:MAG: hypothetical protein AB8H79_04510 [Myxococcota bacterium]
MTGWNTTLDVPNGQRARWNLGSRALWARWAPGEWLLGMQEVGDDHLLDMVCGVGDPVPDEDGAPKLRVAWDGGGSVRLRPAPPPRALLARPDLTLSVPARRTTEVFVGIPLWGQIWVGDTLLWDQSIVRLSDTWFGTPLDGDLCFATRTHLSMDREAVGRKPYRAVCTVQVVNHSDEPLTLERLKIEGPCLDLWRDRSGGLCASTVRVSRVQGRDLDEVLIVSTPPQHATGTEPISKARQPEVAPRLSRALSVVWKGIGSAL